MTTWNPTSKNTTNYSNPTKNTSVFYTPSKPLIELYSLIDDTFFFLIDDTYKLIIDSIPTQWNNTSKS